MTTEQSILPLSLSPSQSRRLDAMVAEKCDGWTNLTTPRDPLRGRDVVNVGDSPSGKRIQCMVPRYATDVAEALRVATEAGVFRDWSLTQRGHGSQRWYLWQPGPADNRYEIVLEDVEASTPALALVYAALLVRGVTVEEMRAAIGEAGNP